MKTITTTEAANIILSRNRRTLFAVTFIKKDGTERRMVARLGCHNRKKTDRSSNTAHIPKYITVFDMHADDFRNINLLTLTRLRSRGVEYIIAREA
jgi:hypothetical protein